MNIVLMGYMGCGKSTVGRYLSSDLEIEYLDLDAFIEAKEKMTIPQLFTEKGEIYFRKKETLYLKECLEAPFTKIISLGGGTPCFAGNLEIIKNSRETVSIYLKTSLEVLIERLSPERDKRPLIAHLNTPEALDDFIRKHLFERSFYYNQAKQIVTTDHKEAKEIAIEIKELLAL